MADDRLQKLKKFQEVMKVVTESLTREEFVAAFKVATDMILAKEERLAKKIDEKTEQSVRVVNSLKSEVDQLVKDVRESNETSLAQLKKRSLESIDSLFQKMRLDDRFSKVLKDYRAKIDELEGRIMEVPVIDVDQIADSAASKVQIPHIAEETPESVRDKLETLSGEDRLDASAIKNLPEVTKQIGTRVGWGAHPLTIQDSSGVVDKNTGNIKFAGTAITSVNRSADGIVTVTVDGGSGAVDSVNSQTGVVVLDTDDISEGATNKYNVTHTGEVTGATSLTLDKTAISNRTAVTAVGADYILIGDSSDGDNLKKALVSDVLGSGSVAWGNVTGTLSNQTDLQTVLDTKVDNSTAIAYAVAL